MTSDITPTPDPDDAKPSDPPGPGWWLASDGQYYPPQGSAPPPPPYGYGYGHGGYGYGGMQPARTNGLAVASLVLGIIWIYWIGSILALVFGYVARSQIKKSGGTQTGSGLAVAGIVLGWIGVAVGLAIAVILVVVGLNGGLDDDGPNSDPFDGVCNSDRYIQDPDC